MKVSVELSRSCMTFVCRGMWGRDGHFASVGQQCERSES